MIRANNVPQHKTGKEFGEFGIYGTILLKESENNKAKENNTG